MVAWSKIISVRGAELTEEQIQEQMPNLYASLLPLLRRCHEKLATFTQEVDASVSIDGTHASAHCYFISLDGNQRPRIDDFTVFLASKVTDFSIPRSRILKALREGAASGSTSPIDALNAEARALFTSQPRSGEGGEVLLSVLSENFLELPQLFTKMVLKTSTEMHAHGADGIHAGVTSSGHLALYWGESKLHADISKAISNCLDSLAPFLKEAGGSRAKPKRDIHLMRDGVDVPSESLMNALKQYLDPDDPMHNNVEFRGLCLVGFDSDCYPTTPNTGCPEDVKKALTEGLIRLIKSFSTSCKNRKLDTFHIDVFFFPFPDVESFRKAFRRELGFADEKV